MRYSHAILLLALTGIHCSKTDPLTAPGGTLVSMAGDGHVIQGEDFPGVVARCSLSSGTESIDVLVQSLESGYVARIWLTTGGETREVAPVAVSLVGGGASPRYEREAFSLQVESFGRGALVTTIDNVHYEREMTCSEEN